MTPTARGAGTGTACCGLWCGGSGWGEKEISALTTTQLGKCPPAPAQPARCFVFCGIVFYCGVLPVQRLHGSHTHPLAANFVGPPSPRRVPSCRQRPHPSILVEVFVGFLLPQANAAHFYCVGCRRCSGELADVAVLVACCSFET